MKLVYTVDKHRMNISSKQISGASSSDKNIACSSFDEERYSYDDFYIPQTAPIDLKFETFIHIYLSNLITSLQKGARIFADAIRDLLKRRPKCVTPYITACTRPRDI